jgi:hypothetical protein
MFTNDLSFYSLFKNLFISTSIYYLSKNFIFNKIKHNIKNRKLNEKRKKIFDFIKEEREKSKNELEKLKSQYYSSIDKEESNHGLIIISARYGYFHDEYDTEYPPIFVDAHIPLQCLVNSSSIQTNQTDHRFINFFK